MGRPFGGFIHVFWQDLRFQKQEQNQIVISDVALCVLCMQLIHEDLQGDT